MGKLLYHIAFYQLFVFSLYSQSSNDIAFQDVQARIDKVAINNEMEAVHIADSLIIYSSNTSKEIDARIILATTWEKSGNYDKAIQSSLDALTEAKATKNLVAESTIYLMIAKQFRSVDFPLYGNIYLQKAENTIKRLENSEEKKKLQGELCLEKGIYLIDKQNFSEGDRNFQLARSIFLGGKSNNTYKTGYLAKTEFLLGKSSYLQNKLSKAFLHYEKAKTYLDVNKSEKKIGYAWLYNGYGNLYLQMNDTLQSEKYIQKSLNLAQIVPSNFLKKAVYDDALSFYKKEKNLDSIAKYSEKYIGILNSIYQSQMGLIKSHNLNREKESYSVKSSIILSILLVIMVIILIAGIAFRIDKKIKADQKSPEFIEKNGANYLPIETELKILSKMDEFEKKNKYLNKKMSLPLLACQLETNSKYLRYILKKHKKKDYTAYINELRIQYIQHKLDTDPHYLQYKISYLAEEAGFSSHSKFTKTFKKLTNCCPSEYIGNA